MSNTKIISKSPGTMDVEYHGHDDLKSIVEMASSKDESKPIAAFDLLLLSKHHMCELLSIDRIQSAMNHLIQVMGHERETFVGRPTNDIYKDIGSINTELSTLRRKLEVLKDNILKGEGHADNT